jgi:hypothetical protein
MYKLSTGDEQMRNPISAIAAGLVLVGALNWGLVAIAEFDLVAWIFGEEFGTTNGASRIVYGLVRALTRRQRPSTRTPAPHRAALPPHPTPPPRAAPQPTHPTGDSR